MPRSCKCGLKNGMIEISASKTYGDRKVLNVERLVLEPAAVYAVIGSNGSGKSTLLQALAGTIKFDGKINFGDICKDETGYMPQKSFAFDMSVMRNLTVTHMAKERRLYRKKALRLLEELDLAHLKRKNAARLSGGETQRLALARLMMSEYRVLLLDEPTASMDINSTALCEKVLKDYYEKWAPTVVIATHSMQQARRIADYVIFMDGGVPEEIGTPEQIFSSPHSEKTKEFLRFNT